jgi:nucleotide-binding universal stress UspA family protein
LRYIAALARSYGAKLVLAHAYEPNPPLEIPPEPLEVWIATPTPREQAEQKGRSLISNLELSDTVEGVVLSEGTVAGLMHDLEALHPDLLVVATHARHGLRKLLGGSISEEVFRSSAWPVLVVPAVHFEHPMPAHFRRVLYATDLSSLSATALLYAAGIAEDHAAELIMLHVDSHRSAGFSFDRTLDLQKLEDWLHEHRHDLTGVMKAGEKIVRFGNAAEEIVKAERQLEADLIVLGARGFGDMSAVASHFFAGPAYQVACSATCPVLIVPHRA